MAEQGPRGLRRTPDRLSTLPAPVLSRIIGLVLAPPTPSPVRNTLLVSRRFNTIALSVFYRQLDTSTLTGVQLRQFLLLLDRDFDRRLSEYTLRNFPPPGTLPIPITDSSFFPLTPSNAFASANGPLFRRHIVALRLSSKWDSTSDLRPQWTGKYGFPFAAVPVILDILRLRLPGLSRLWLDLPKSILTRPAELQSKVDTVVQDILIRLERFTTLNHLFLDAWNFQEDTITPILVQLDGTLLSLALRRHPLTTTSLSASTATHNFGFALRRLTISDCEVDIQAIPFVLKALLNLVSFALLGFHFDLRHAPSIDVFVQSCSFPLHPHSRTPPIAPIRSFVWRPSYRVHHDEYHPPMLFAVLLAISPTLVNLHLGYQHADSAFLLPLVSSGCCPRLECLWIGFLSAQDEIGDGVRLSVADDRRVRMNILRTDEGLREVDDFVGGTTGGWVPPLSERRGGLVSERVVLGR
ncbi:hypothetical protein MNV49_004757 [Pseudohyphozyma bogoriensis]|nr:hypothetical protein MNV49_004757 [Pseudohyphozyma bogoriensis]